MSITPRPARPLALTVVLAALALPAGAATIPVAAGEVVVANNGLCSLREAIHNANANAQVDNADCLAGSGADTISLATDAVYVLPDADPGDSSNGLPKITTTVVLAGNGARIERDGTFPCRLNGTRTAQEFRLMGAASPAVLTLANVTLQNGCGDGPGTTKTGGALAVGAGATVTIDHTAILGSAAGGNGGGVENLGTLTVFDSTIAGNTAWGRGGGVDNAAGATAAIDASTISGNAVTGPPGGGGVGNAGAITVKNSIVAGNLDGSDCATVAGTFTALGKNLDQDGSCVALSSSHFTKVTATQLALAPLSFSPVVSGKAPALLPLFGSVAVDAVTDCTRIDGSTVVSTDQLGNARPQDGNTTAGASCDIGAVEKAPVGEVHAVGGACTLGDAIEAANGDSTIGGCVDNQPGPDVLMIGANVALSVADTVRSTELWGAYAALPDVSSEIVIVAGSGSVVERAPTTSACTSPDPSDEFRLFNVTASGRLTLVGITVRNGCADSGGGALVVGGRLAALGGEFTGHTAISEGLLIGTPKGGAIAFDGSTSAGAFIGTHFIGNLITGVNFGGGAIATDGPLAIPEALFTGNSAVDGGGGAILVTDNAPRGSLTISGATFTSNQTTGSNSAGGAIGDNWGLAFLCDSLFVTNTAGSPGGGALYTAADHPRLSGLVFDRNIVTAGNPLGGAFYYSGLGDLTLVRSRFVGNVAQAPVDQVGAALGGGAYLPNAHGVLSGVTFENNLARSGDRTSDNANEAAGGGLMTDGGDVALVNVTFTGNRAVGGSSTSGTGGNASGGGLYSYPDASANAQFLSFADNQAIAGSGGAGNGAALGGGVFIGGATSLGSSVLEGNTSTAAGVTIAEDCFEDNGPYLTSLGFNTVGAAGKCGFGATGDQVNAGSSLLAVGDHGCVTKLPDGSCVPTMPVSLLGPALDAGTCNLGDLFADARAFDRPFDVLTVTNADDGCDAGAFESRDADGDGVEDSVDSCPALANALQVDLDVPFSQPPVAIWRLDEGQGTTAKDPAGSHDGTLNGNPRWTVGVSGGGLALDGSGDGVVIPHSAALDFGTNQSFTISAWVKLPANQVTTSRTTNLIVGQDQEGGVGFPFPWVLRVFNQTAGANAGRLQGSRSDGALFPAVISTSRVDDGRWHHAAYVKRGSALEMWVDGVLEATTPDTTTATTTNSKDVGIGLRHEASAKLDLRGSVDEVAVFASALPAGDLALLSSRRNLAGDGVGTGCDNCSAIYNPDQTDGDSDGIGAACDCDDSDPTNTSLACNPTPLPFANGFESGSTSAWSLHQP